MSVPAHPPWGLGVCGCKGYGRRVGSPGTVRPTYGKMAVVGRDERPRSSAVGLERLVGYENRGWLKPPPPDDWNSGSVVLRE